MKRLVFGALLFLTPAFVFAAGFAKQSIFLSTATPVEGQTVLIYASVSNPSTTIFNGSLVIKGGASEIGSVPVKLAAGGADNVSVSWKPAAGTHIITADFKDADGTVLEQGRETFTIGAAPASTGPTNPFGISNIQAGDVQPSTPIQESIDNVSPAVGEYASPVLKAIDSGRAIAAKQLNAAADWSKSQIATSSKAASAQEKGSWLQTALRIFATVALYVLTVLLYIVTNVGIFYPLLAVLFLYVLWKLSRRYRRR